MLAGSFLIAASFNIFLVPNGIASGGVSGISILVKQRYGIFRLLIHSGLSIFRFSFSALWLLGKRFGAQNRIRLVVLPLFVLLTSHVKPPTDNPLLAAIYGGIGVGAGLGLVFRGGGSTGGLDLAAQMLHRYTGHALGLAVAMLRWHRISLRQVFLFRTENALYALIGLVRTSKTIDFVQTGLPVSKVAFIITEQPEEITASDAA